MLIVGPHPSQPQAVRAKAETPAADWQKLRSFFHKDTLYLLASPPAEKADLREHYRNTGALAWNALREHHITEVHLSGSNNTTLIAAAFGIAMRNYRFERYKGKPSPFGVSCIHLPEALVSDTDIKNLHALIAGIALARDLVNEPANVLTATALAERIENEGKEAGFETEVLHKARIEALRMGGILSVNKGSTEPPTFTIMRYCHPDAAQQKPLVLVGKGVVYDTGGHSLKPTPHSMDIMKCDMAGAAAVAGVFSAVARTRLVANLVGLVPATDNRLSPDAYSPGDVISMYNGMQVEVMNTDAEGRLLLADALAYAAQLEPALVIDLATLTGSSMHTVAYFGAAAMGTAPEETKAMLTKAGEETYERLAWLPLWDEFAQDLESDIADLKNLGSDPLGGAIKAGKFLERFTSYPWVHLDIAGPAFLPAARGYLPKGATGYGVHLLFQYIINRKP